MHIHVFIYIYYSYKNTAFDVRFTDNIIGRMTMLFKMQASNFKTKVRKKVFTQGLYKMLNCIIRAC